VLISHEKREIPSCPACGYVQYVNPSPGVVVLVERNGKILIGKRNGEVGGGKWSLPGGYIGFDEDYLSAAHREVREETGLAIELKGILSVVSNFIRRDVHTLVIVLYASAAGGKEAAGDDFDDLRWIDADSPLPAMAFDSDIHIIERYFADFPFGAPIEPGFRNPGVRSHDSEDSYGPVDPPPERRLRR
jgi:ADP-ribose pyrophosphatase YjhB (NUDIX family)